jgi:hypothetical protein
MTDDDCHRGSSGVASTTLAELVRKSQERNGLTIGESLDGMGRSGFGFVMLLLALPAMIPVPGPFGMVFGSALAIVALQFTFGVRAVWLPALLRNRRISANAFGSLERYASPWIARIERLVRPGRVKVLTGRQLPYFLGLPVFALAIAIALPIPFGNIIPVLAICVMAVGLIERDGLVLLIGLGIAIAAFVVTALLLGGAASLIGWAPL